MSKGQVSLISGGQKVTLLELDGLTVQALSALLYDQAKKSNALLRIKVSTEQGERIVHMLPELVFVFESDEQFEPLEVNKHLQLLRSRLGMDGLLIFGADGELVEPALKAKPVRVHI